VVAGPPEAVGFRAGRPNVEGHPPGPAGGDRPSIGFQDTETCLFFFCAPGARAAPADRSHPRGISDAMTFLPQGGRRRRRGRRRALTARVALVGNVQTAGPGTYVLFQTTWTGLRANKTKV